MKKSFPFLLSFFSLFFLLRGPAHAAFGQKRVSAELVGLRYSDNGYMPDFGGGMDLAYGTTFGLSGLGIGFLSGFRFFEETRDEDEFMEYSTFPFGFLFFGQFPLKYLDLQFDVRFGPQFTRGRFLRFQDAGPDWDGQYYRAGETQTLLFLGGFANANLLLTRRIGFYDLGLRLGFEAAAATIGRVEDAYNPPAFGSGPLVGIHLSRWFGAHARRKGR